MVLAVLLLVLTCTVVAQRTPVEQVCVDAGKELVLASNKRNCPCFVEAIVAADIEKPDVRAVVYAVRASEFSAWVDAARSMRRAGKALPNVPGLSLGTVSNFQFDSREGRFTWRSGKKTIDADGSFVLTVLLNGGKDQHCIYAAIRLEPKPVTCPLRLAPASRSNVAASGKISNGIVKPQQSEVANGQPDSLTVFDINAFTRPSTYVVGGTAVEDEFQLYNALVRTRRGRCSASVISQRWVLTAAHCNVQVGDTVFVGGDKLTNGKRYRVTYAVPHPNFIHENDGIAREVRIVNDLALLKVSRSMAGRAVFLNGNNDGPPPGTVVRATGYGQVTTGVSGDNLRMVDISVLSTEECKARFIRTGGRAIAKGFNENLSICIGGDERCKRGGVCFGDSGGPVVARNVDGKLIQVGVVSYGDTVCAGSNSADVYVRVSMYSTWIQEVTSNAATVIPWGSAADSGHSAGGLNGMLGPLPIWAFVAIGVGILAVVVSLILGIWHQVRARRRARHAEEGPTEAEQQPGQFEDDNETRDIEQGQIGAEERLGQFEDEERPGQFEDEYGEPIYFDSTLDFRQHPHVLSQTAG